MKLTINNGLILISIIFTFVAFSNPYLYSFGINSLSFFEGNYLMTFLQFCLYSFLHGSLLHLFSNILFLYLFGNPLEMIIGQKRFLLFFILATVFNGIAIIILTVGTTIGISGFCMAMLSFYTLTLYEVKNPEYKGGITALVLNILVGFIPGVSLIGHLFGAIFGVLFYFIEKYFLRRKLLK